MRRFIQIVLAAAVVCLGVGSSSAQYYKTYYYPATTYLQPTTVAYVPPATTYCYRAVPAATYTYSVTPAPTTVYYTVPVATSYRPLVGQSITRVGYRTPAVTYRPVSNTYQMYYPWW
jgi:hypothetical protein